MTNTSVFCIASSRSHAESIVTALIDEGFANDDVSVLLPDTATTRDFAHEKHTKASEGALAGAGAGGVLGGVLGWIAGLGVLAIPGAGPLLAEGPLLAALSAAAVGAAAGGVAGGLIGLGIPEIVAKRYAGKIQDGNILIAVHAANPDVADQVRELFEEFGAYDICETDEEAIPASREIRHP